MINRIAHIIMELMLTAFALIGGYTVAGWVGVGVVIAFMVTQIVSTAIRLRSPRARMLRAIARELPKGEDFLIHIHRLAPDDSDVPAPFTIPTPSDEE